MGAFTKRVRVMKPQHKVQVTYERQFEEEQDIVETLSFSTWQGAQDFKDRQKNIPAVRDAKYLGSF